MGGGCCGASRAGLKKSQQPQVKMPDEWETPTVPGCDNGDEVVDPCVPVTLNVYNLQKKEGKTSYNLNALIGLGIYHTGIEIFSNEWAYWGSTQPRPGVSGIICGRPKSMPPAYMHERSHLLGYLPSGTNEQRVLSVVNRLHPEWEARSYNMLKRNCNHFTKAFRNALAEEFPDANIGKIPSYVNRAARFARVLVPRALVPSVYAPVSLDAPANEKQQATSKSLQKRAEHVRGSGLNPRVEEEHQGVVASAKGPRTRDELEAMTVQSLKTLMWLNWLSLDGCRDKSEMVEALLKYQMAEQRQHQKQRERRRAIRNEMKISMVRT